MSRHKGFNPKEVWYQYVTDNTDDSRLNGVENTPEYIHASDGIEAIDHATGDSPLGEPYNLWDAERGVVMRHVNASWLDTHAQTKDNMDAFLERMKYRHVEELVIHNDRPKCGNPHYRRFSSRSIEAFRIAVTTKGITCHID